VTETFILDILYSYLKSTRELGKQATDEYYGESVRSTFS